MDRICYAVGCNNRIIKTKKNNLHCEEHRNTFYQQYREYKSATHRIQRYLDNPLLLDKISNEDVLMTATRFHIAAHLRKEYQSIAIKKELRDEGHVHMAEKLLQISLKLIARLDVIEREEEEDKEQEDIIEVEKITSKTIKQDYYNLEQEFDKCIKQNDIILVEIESKLLKLINLVNKGLSYPIFVHGSDMFAIDNTKSILDTLNHTIRLFDKYQMEISPFDPRSRTLIRRKMSVPKCVGDFNICSQSNKCPADFFNQICIKIMRGDVHPYDCVFSTPYINEMIDAIRTVIMAEREWKDGYVCWFSKGNNTKLVFELTSCSINDIPDSNVVTSSAEGKYIKNFKLSSLR